MPQDGGAAALTAAGRVLAVLDVFRLSPTPVTLTEISRSAGLSMTTTHRLTHELLEWHALEQTDDGRYRLGTKMLELVTTSAHAMQMRERALPWLVRLNKALRNVVVHLAIRDGDESVYVESLRTGNGTVRMNRIGGRLPLHATATGWVLLAHADEAVQERVLAAPMAVFTPETVTDPEVLRHELAEIRRVGSCVTRSQMRMETGGIAAPVTGRGGEIVASVGIVVNLAGSKLEDYTPIVCAAAKRISTEIASL